jgi:hypothetical protein
LSAGGRAARRVVPRRPRVARAGAAAGGDHDAELRVLRKGFARVATGEEIAGWLAR